MSERRRPEEEGEGDTAVESVPEAVGRLRTDVDQLKNDMEFIKGELRQRPTKFQVILGALTVAFVLLTPVAIFASSLVTLATSK